MSKTKFLLVENFQIALAGEVENEFISLTDICRKVGDEKLIENWIRNKKTIEFLAVWEKINNPNFKPLKSEGIGETAENKDFVMSPKRWVSETADIGIVSKSGRYGGTYAHKDIAFEFCMLKTRLRK